MLVKVIIIFYQQTKFRRMYFQDLNLSADTMKLDASNANERQTRDGRTETGLSPTYFLNFELHSGTRNKNAILQSFERILITSNTKFNQDEKTGDELCMSGGKRVGLFETNNVEFLNDHLFASKGPKLSHFMSFNPRQNLEPTSPMPKLPLHESRCFSITKKVEQTTKSTITIANFVEKKKMNVATSSLTKKIKKEPKKAPVKIATRIESHNYGDFDSDSEDHVQYIGQVVSNW
jgi:hypothetical protein